eukprot:jgi/Bigna1/67507/fgenesh1_pg.4_\
MKGLYSSPLIGAKLTRIQTLENGEGNEQDLKVSKGRGLIAAMDLKPGDVAVCQIELTEIKFVIGALVGRMKKCSKGVPFAKGFPTVVESVRFQLGRHTTRWNVDVSKPFDLCKH